MTFRVFFHHPIRICLEDGSSWKNTFFGGKRKAVEHSGLGGLWSNYHTLPVKPPARTHTRKQHRNESKKNLKKSVNKRTPSRKSKRIRSKQKRNPAKKGPNTLVFGAPQKEGSLSLAICWRQSVLSRGSQYRVEGLSTWQCLAGRLGFSQPRGFAFGDLWKYPTWVVKKQL